MKQDVAAYYEQTQNHYKRWWKLDKGMSLHYGLWFEKTKTFLEALENTNEYMAGKAKIKANDLVLDAGCGVGGAAIYLAHHRNAKVIGVSLSERQVKTAKENAVRHNVADRVSFFEADYCQTTFANGSFDIIWACESSSSASDKRVMLQEWHRLLKPQGKLILLDFFRSSDKLSEDDSLLDRWSELWAMSPLISADEFKLSLEANQFRIIEENDLTKQILPTIKWLYRSSLLGSLPSLLYNLFFGARKYSKNHFKSGLYQYRAYRKGLWKYCAFLAEKSDPSHQKK